ncbi:putative histone-lysine N-methyltransferase ATXR4 isoform X1 [Iris pallida]|uniref:Histone-lysine N-methyltransferase ATXR4 isoform X1 n=1 Tax=Iris pallida TaxID=29817 RepID=A0AAX6FW02_IRIPA|nr:putative histone-lysine N-methyltransferase ATXR4 isoform X1 [Iris pallida]
MSSSMYRQRMRIALALRHHSHRLRSLSSAAAVERRGGPPPIRVAITESAGRGVFATRPIAAGELIHTAKPVVAHPSPYSPSKVCYYCLRKLGEEEESPAAAHAHFCSDSCRHHSKVFYEVERKADWSIFDDHCRAREVKYPFMAKRLACMVISGAASVDSLDILQPSSLFQETISEARMGEQFELLRRTFVKAQIEENLTAFLTKEWYISVLARIRINAFRIELVAGSYEDLLASASASVSADAASGNAVYMLPSFYNHDCDPNAHILWIDNVDARLKALRDIEAGEELRICYIDASMDYGARQNLLTEGFGFRCSCLRCLSRD